MTKSTSISPSHQINPFQDHKFKKNITIKIFTPFFLKFSTALISSNVPEKSRRTVKTINISIKYFFY